MGNKVGALEDMELKRAQFAFDKVKGASGWDDKRKRELRSYLVKLPTLIMNNGLIMTLAFIRSKKEKAYEYIYSDILKGWLKEYSVPLWGGYDGQDLLEFALNLSPEELLYLTQELMRLAEWLKRMAEAELPSESSSKGSADSSTEQ